MIHYDCCPVCDSKNVFAVFDAKDYLVSGKYFTVYECRDCTGRFTQDVPAQNEIGAYYQSEDYISHSDTSKGLVNKLYRRIRTITLKQKLRLVQAQSGLSSGALLDVGCGSGAFLKTVSDAGWTVKGLEPDENARAKAMQLYGLTVHPIEDLYSTPPQCKFMM